MTGFDRVMIAFFLAGMFVNTARIAWYLQRFWTITAIEKGIKP